MRWIEKDYENYYTYADGHKCYRHLERRNRRRFLLFPKNIAHTIRWLEWAVWEEQWNEASCETDRYYWYATRWVN